MRRLWFLVGFFILMVGLACGAPASTLPTATVDMSASTQGGEVSTDSPTIMPMCTAPACAEGEVYHCPGNCPNGCGIVCATVTPSGESPVTAALSETGPWLVFPTASENGFPYDTIYATDGTAVVTLLQDQRIVAPYHFEEGIAPTGGHVAFITSSDDMLHNLTLNLLTLPSGEVQVITPLTSPETEVGTGDMIDLIGTANFEAARAMSEVQSLAWSPDGTRLAFMGAMQGTTSDLYVYSVLDGSITQLTSGPSQGIKPNWSPDGRYIVHFGVSGLGTGAGYGMEGAWAVDTTTEEVITLYTPDSGDEGVFGWIDNETVLLASWRADCGYQELRTHHIPSGQSEMLFDNCFQDVVFAPGTSKLLMSVPDSGFGDAVAGLYLLDLSDAATLPLTNVAAGDVEWVPQLDRFFAQSESAVVEVAVDGTVVDYNMNTLPPVVSPDGTLWVWWGNGYVGIAGLWAGPANIAVPPTQLYGNPVADALWSPDGQRVIFFTESGVYGITRAQVENPAGVTLTPLVEDLYVPNQFIAGWVLP